MYVVEDMVCGTSDCENVRGIYSNLALAARAVMQAIKEYSNNDGAITFNYYAEPWGYYFEIIAHTYGDAWLCGEIKIIRMVVNE